MASNLNNTGYMRLKDVLEVYPVGKSTWWKGVKDGRYPKQYRISPRLVGWLREDISALIEKSKAQ